MIDRSVVHGSADDSDDCFDDDSDDCFDGSLFSSMTTACRQVVV